MGGCNVTQTELKLALRLYFSFRNYFKLIYAELDITKQCCTSKL